MMEMVVLAVTLVIAQMIGGFFMTFVMMKYYMRKETIKKLAKISYEVTQELEDEMF